MTNFIDLPGEIWKDIDGYDGRYQVSNMGRVRATILWSGRNYVNRHKILKPRDNGRCYMRVSLKRPDGVITNEQVSHLVAEAFCENPHGYVEVDHINADRKDNRACNLQWCTHSENVQWGYDRRGHVKQPPKRRPPTDPDRWGSKTGHLYVRPSGKKYAVSIRGKWHGTFPTLEAAVARRNEIMGWSF